MAAPIALAQLATSLISYQGAKRSGSAEERAYQARAFASDMDAADLELQAELEKTSTNYESSRLRRKIDSTQASQRAAVAASGIELSGSALQVLAQSAEEQELDALILRFNGDARVLGRQRSAAMARFNSAALRTEGSVAKSTRKAAASGTLLTGLTNSYNAIIS